MWNKFTEDSDFGPDGEILVKSNIDGALLKLSSYGNRLYFHAFASTIFFEINKKDLCENEDLLWIKLRDNYYS